MKWRRKYPKLTVKEVKEKLKPLNQTFPPIFYEWMAEYHQAELEDWIEIETEVDDRVFHRVFSLEQMVNLHQDDVDNDEGFEKIYPFAWDGGKNNFCFDYRDPKRPWIIFMDTDYFISYNPEAAEKVCRTFEEFLAILNEQITP
ncbi:SMI1/KNR4 family protein [Melghirimyces algeriensis]|uniref:SMI1-KNR4 cell-wall n=1 Tax=Melghirimyces algeriensis TaxID=910412 RepID=A0A521FGL4_9BACL|nr:SMI1/KNR4 family protein [Melghirimyces algeriensis]SMO95265.1 SMI1-KNR4 cell-wall [Melghirimyces algeriensis]